MANRTRKLAALALATTMVVPGTAFAAEANETAKGIHAHSYDCYEYTCGNLEHTHKDKCYLKWLFNARICGKKEHKHTDDCKELVCMTVTNGNALTSVKVKVTDETGKVVPGADVTISMKDNNWFFGAPDIDLTATTNTDGYARFKVSSAYDKILSYDVSCDGYETYETPEGVVAKLGLFKGYEGEVSIEKNEYTVTFMNGDTVYDKQTVKAGESAVAPAAPTYDGNSDYNMIFAAWDSEFDNVTGDMVVKAIYDKKVKNQSVDIFVEKPEATDDSIIKLNGDKNIQYNDIFNQSIGVVKENENGIIEMSDGAKISIEDGMVMPEDFAYTVAGQSDVDIKDGYIFCETEDGDLYKADLSLVDWNTYSVGTQIIGSVQWEKVIVADVNATGEYNRVAVHDPSIIKDTKTGEYYIFGSHMAWAKSTDLVNWTPFTNNINTNFREIFAAESAWAGKAQANYDVSGNLWAPDVIWNEDMGKWCMYMSVNGNDWNSTISLLTADSLDGDWTYVGPVIQSGMSKGYGVTFDYTLVTGEDTVNSRYTNHVRNTVPTYEPHAIDPCVTYDDEGNLWMSYGSWSGGIGMIRLDNETGLRDYDVTYELDEQTLTDPYTGYKLAGGNQRSGEASYIEKIGDYYYLFMSYGGLVANGGYSMRIFRSENITGPYVDETGDYARYKLNDNVIGSTGYGDVNGKVGVKLMTYYQWSFAKYGQVAQGHNSAFVDEDGKAYVVYHTRTNDGTEGHSVRVHQLFVNEDGWILAAPHEYTGETLREGAYEAEEVVGTYEVLYHKTSINYTGLECVKPQKLTLNADGTVSGDYIGTWMASENSADVTVTLDGVEYKGVFVEQYVEETTYKTMCFTLLGENEVCVWGSKYLEGKDAVDFTQKAGIVKFPSSTVGNVKFETEGLYGTTVTYESQNQEVLSNDGIVAPVEENTDVLVKATFTNGDYSEVKEFTVTVIESEDGKILVGSYYIDNPLDISSAKEGEYRFPNPFNKSVTEGLEIYNGVSIEFDVEGTGFYLSNILSFQGSGRLYFTGGSYLGYNAAGGFFDANVMNGSAAYGIWGPGTDYINGKAHVEIKILGNTFEVYVNDELAYTYSDIGTENVPGSSSMTSFASVLSWLNNTAETIDFGWGSWWNDNFNGTISNVKLYANEIENVYYKDFSDSDISEWVSANAQAYITVGNDGNEYGSYAQFAPGNQNTRGAQYTFDMENSVSGEYTVSFDTKLTAGNNQTTGFGLTGKDLAYVSKNMNYGLSSGYIFYMTAAAKSTTWTIANADAANNTVVIPAGAWVNVKAEVNTEEGIAVLTIKNGEEVLYAGTVTISGLGEVGGIYVMGGRYNSVTAIDNVAVKEGRELEMSEDGFYILSEYDSVTSPDELLDKVAVNSNTGLSVSFELDAEAASDWDSNVVSSDWSYQQGTMICTFTTDGWATRKDFFPHEGTFTEAGNALIADKNIAPWQSFLGTTARMTISYNPDGTVDFYLDGEHIFSYSEEKNPGIAAFIEGMVNSAANSGLRFARAVNNVKIGYSIDYSSR